jgi:hypothetical protein
MIDLHISDWDDEFAKLPALPARVIRTRVLTGGEADVRQTPDGLTVAVPERDRQPLDTIVALELDRPALDLPPLDVPAPPSLTRGAIATASNWFHGQAEFGPDKAVDGRADTRWATDAGTRSAWLEVDLGQARTFRRAVIKQAFPELKRIRQFAVEYWQNNEWKACYRGQNAGEKVVANFAPVTAQRVRLNITEAREGPTICEFQLF